MGADQRRATGTPAGQLARRSYRPRSQDDLAPSGPAARISGNLAALRVLRAIEREHRPATPLEQKDLAGWSGWGAIPEVFDEARAEHWAARGELRRLLTGQEYAAASRSTINAHYTDAAIVQAIWAAVQRLGFEGGRVLEPGCGSGNFIAFAPPGALVTGVEVEPVTAAIAAALYPEARILAESFAATSAADGSFDLVVGNVPFGGIVLTDRRHNRAGHSIHNHFIVKALALTRPGGIAAVLTSRYTMDARNPAARRDIAALADLLGAVRLPAGAHHRAAGTKVVTDLLILRRREPGRDPHAVPWERVWPVGLDGHEVEINEYFLDYPDAVLGSLGAVNGPYRAGELTVRPAGELIPALNEALARITDGAHEDGLSWSPAPASPAMVRAESAGAAVRPEGLLEAHADGTFTQANGGRAEPFPVPRAQAAELRALLGLRDTARALLDAEAATAQDTPQIERLRGELGSRYGAYLSAYGPLNRFSWRRTGREGGAMARVRPGQGGFRADPYAPLVYALEDWDPIAQQAARTAIFTRRVVAPRSARQAADSPADALAICLDLCGEPRLGEIARLLGVDEQEARGLLGTLVFDEPGTGRLVPAAEYLSGQVRGKLRSAEQAAAGDPRFAVNVAGLREVIPRDLGPGEIDARLGAAWVGADRVQEFLREILDDESLRVEHPGGQMWTVRGNRHTVLATSTWGTERFPGPALAQAVLEQRVIEVRDKLAGDSWVLNLDATLAAQEKAAELGERFAAWAWEDPERAVEMAAVYNEKFNSIVLRSYDGTTLTLPGLAAGFEPRPHQVAAVARIINEPAVLLAHEVGAGKTAEMVMGAMELRRLGLAAKPAIIVPNHMLDQFASEWLHTYPQARVLVAQREDLQGERRRRFVARCATGEWDGIIISRSAFERIPMSADAQRAYLDRELAQLREWLAEARSGEGLSVKRLEAALLRAEERLRGKLDRARDNGITFEATGIDYLFVDEAHGYKNLRTPSAIRDAAIDGSIRASDLDMKISYLRARNGARVVTFATATPIANSVTEAHVMQRYLRPDLLEAAGIAVFDSWAATFGQVVTQVELAPEGGDSFRMKTRFAKFRNVPEMLRLFHVAADVKTGDDLNLPAPALVERPGDGQRLPQTVITDPTPELRAYVAALGKRAEAVRSRAVLPDEDNMLKISGDGRKAALDLRLVGLPQTGPSKIDTAADVIARIWREHHGDVYPGPDGEPSPVRGSLQIVFCDLGTPGPGWNVYDYLRAELIARGVPGEQVRYVHEARTDRDKAEVFAACRAGRVAVLIGSTEKMGVGTNVQTRAIALHHLDAPWRPADVAQREGRILRQGNLNPEVSIHRHSTRLSFDGYVWQTLERKSRFVAQVMRGRLDVREIEDIGDAALSYTEVKALATGNPLLMDKAKADAELTRLERAERAHHRAQDALRHTTTRLRARIERLEELAGEIDTAIARRTSTRGEAFAMDVGGITYTKRVEAGARVKRVLTDAVSAVGPGERRQVRVGRLGGFEVTAQIDRILGTVEVALGIDGAPGQDVRMTLAELSEADTAGLVIRLENRLARLEDHKTDTLAETDRARAELGHAQDSVGAPFAQASQLAAARNRSRQIDEQLREAATAPPPDADQPGPDEADQQQDQGEQRADHPARRADRPDQPAPAGPDPQQDHPDRPDQGTDHSDHDRDGDRDRSAWTGPAEEEEPAPTARPGTGPAEKPKASDEQEGRAMARADTGGSRPDPQSDAEPGRAELQDGGRRDEPGRTEPGAADREAGADQPEGRVAASVQRQARHRTAVRREPPHEDQAADGADRVRDAVTGDPDPLTDRDTGPDEPPDRADETDQQRTASADESADRDSADDDQDWDEDVPIPIDPQLLKPASTRIPADPDPLLPADIAAALRQLPAQDLAELLTRPIRRARLADSGVIGGSQTVRGPGLPGAGAFDQVDFNSTGIRIRSSNRDSTRAGSLTWPQASLWLQPGLTQRRLQLLDSAEQALGRYRAARPGSQAWDTRDELSQITATAVGDLIRAALHAYDPADGGQFPDADPATLNRVGELLAALPADGVSHGRAEFTDLPSDVELERGLDQVIGAIAERRPPSTDADSETERSEFADIRAAFTELRMALDLPPDGFPVLMPWPPSAVGNETDSIQRMAKAIAEVNACAASYSGAPEWKRITSVTDAARTLVTAIREAAGDYWAELRRDARLRGFARTVAARVARALSSAAGGLTRNLQQNGRGHTLAGRAAQQLHHAAANCAVRLMEVRGADAGDRMSEVADIVAHLGRTPRSQVAEMSAERQGPHAHASLMSGPVGLVRACFPRTPTTSIHSEGRADNRPRALSVKERGQRAGQRRQ